MKKITFLIIFILASTLIGLGAYFNEADNSSDLKKETEKTEPKPTKNDEIVSDIPEEPFFDYEETKLDDNRDNEDVIKKASSTKPKIVKAIYLTSYSASLERKIEEVINLISVSEINAVVIDINNFSGKLAYDSSIPAVNEHNLDSNRIKDIRGLVKRLHDNDIYVIARTVVFQNTALAKARPDFALLSSSTESIWYDDADQGWLDPASKDARRFVVEVAQEAFNIGFDEVNFDYIRFPSDGSLDDISFPVWDRETYKTEVLSEVFKYIRENLPGKRISVDLFGLTTVNRNGLGIGQLLEDAYKYFDVISPMVYPSHYANGSFGIQNPAEKPYEIILVSLVNSVLRLPGIDYLEDYKNNKSEVEIRPWLQDFDLGADYGPDKIKAQIDAVHEVLGDSAGFMLWNPRNIYTWDALRKD